MSTNPDWQFGHFDVLFDPKALDAQRHQVHRLHGIQVAGYSVLAVFVGLVVLAILGDYGLMGLGFALILFAPIFLLLGVLVVIAIRNRRRSAGWAYSRPVPGTVALRLATAGVWIGGSDADSGTMYAWEDLERVQLLNLAGTDRELALVPRPGVRPSRVVTVGFEGLADQLGILRPAFGQRGPRLVLMTLEPTLSVLDAAFQHYSGGRQGIRYT